MDNKPKHDNTKRYTPEEIDLVLRCLIDAKSSRFAASIAIANLEAIASNPDDENQPTAQSVLDWINDSKQFRNRCIYDIRRVNYGRMLELILEDKGIARIVNIIEDGEAVNAQKAVEFLHNVTHGKPTQRVEVTGFVTQGELRTALDAEVIKSADGVWENPEDALTDDPDESAEQAASEISPRA